MGVIFCVMEALTFITQIKENELVKQYYKIVILALIAIVVSIISISAISFKYLSFDFTSIFFSTLVVSSIYLCIGLGLTLTYKLLNFANFAHAEYMVIGAYTTLLVEQLSIDFLDGAQWHNLIFALSLSFLAGGGIALVGDLLIFAPLRKKQASTETLMVASLGWALFLRYGIGFYFGALARRLEWDELFSPLKIPTVIIGSLAPDTISTFYLAIGKLSTIVIASISVTTLFLVFKYTKFGKSLRASADNRDLAESSGINTESSIRKTWFIGGGLAGFAGVFFGIAKFPIEPQIGFFYLLPAFAVVILGGIGSFRGAIISSLILGFTYTISFSYLTFMERWGRDFLIPFWHRSGLSAFSTIIPYFVLILVIFFRPKGIFGED